MPSPRKRLIVCVLCPAFLLGAAQDLPQIIADSSPENLPRSVAPAIRVEKFALDLRRPVTRRLADHFIHHYTVELKRGQVLDAQVEQNGVDIHTTIAAPGREHLFEIDSLSGDQGAERIFLLAKAAGQYSLYLEGDNPRGTYTLRVASVRDATPEDRIDFQAEELFYDARTIRKDKPDEAIDKYRKAEELWGSIGRAPRQANALERMAQVQIKTPRTNDWKQYVEICRRSLALYEAMGDQSAQARVLVQLGVSYRQVGDLLRAERNYLQADQIAKSLHLANQEWEALSNMAVLNFVRGEYWESLEFLDQSIAISERERNAEQQVENLLVRSLVLKALGKYNEAEAVLLDANRRLTTPRDIVSRAKIRDRLSEIYLARGDFEGALTLSIQALEDRRKGNDVRGEGVTLAEIGLIYQAAKDLTRARDTEEKALSIFQKVGSPTDEAIAHVNLGDILLDQKDLRGAMSHFSQGLRIGREQEFRLAEVSALFGTARVEQARGDEASALKILDDLVRLLETMTRASVKDEVQSHFLRIRHRSYELLPDLLIRSTPSLTPKADLARAFEATERADWRALFEGVQTARVRRLLHTRGDGPRLQAVWSLEARIRKKDIELRQLERQGRSLKGAVRELERLEEQLQIAETQLLRSNPRNPRKDLVDPVSLEEMQAMLTDDTVLLRYHLGEERSLLYFVTPTSIQAFSLPREVELEELATKVNSFFSQRSSPEELTQRRLNELGEKLLGPVASQLGQKRLIVVPDGQLHAVPFVLLPEPSSHRIWEGGWREPLISQHEIVILPSASVLKAIRSTKAYRSPLKKRLAVLAAPQYSSDYAPLLYSRDEAKNISQYFDSKSRLIALGPDASLQLATSDILSGYDIIHFATHAENHPESAQLSSIILSQFDSGGLRVDGKLRFSDIRNLYLPSSLVVLSACETGLGEHVEGEGWVGLGHAFLYAGASRVISSLWNVNDESTADFMADLYEGMFKKRLTPAQALRQAQLRMAGRGMSPYYWAGFQIQGEWR